MRSRPATRATIPSSARGSPTSRSGSACSGPAAATGTAIPSRARPTARSAPRRCRSSGWTGWRSCGRGPPAPVRLVSLLLAAGSRAPDFTAEASDGRDLHASASCWPSPGCCWRSIPATTRLAETANSPPCATSCRRTPDHDIRPFGVNPASAESHAGVRRAAGAATSRCCRIPDLAISARLRRAQAGRAQRSRGRSCLIDRDGTVRVQLRPARRAPTSFSRA